MTADSPPAADRLAALSCHPYAVDLGRGPAPMELVRRLPTGMEPAVLSGDWLGGGTWVLHQPLVEHRPADVREAAKLVDDRPTEAGSFASGGGWLCCLGYTPGATRIAFYDQVLRCGPDGRWIFETLGVVGREEATRSALDLWRWLLADRSGGLAGDAEPDRWADAGHRPGRGYHVGPFRAVSAGGAQEEYLGAVEAAIGRIHRGDLYQVNVCTRLSASFAGSALALFADLVDALNPRFGAFLGGSQPVVSLSPELFLRVRGRQVTTSPIKGTAPRTDRHPSAAALTASAKDAAENIMIVDLMRNDLSKVSAPGSVTVQSLLHLEAHPGVWHLVSTVSGKLADEADLGELLGAAFPPGSVTGAPKYTATQAIDDLEGQPRGVYTGSLGLVTPAGADFSVAIRTFEVTRTGLELGVGSGITVDSTPINEWYECLHKAAPLVSAAGSELAPELSLTGRPVPTARQRAHGVFESILVVEGQPRRVAAHLARLDRSCRELYGTGLPSDLPERIRLRCAMPDSNRPPRQALRVVVPPRLVPTGIVISLSSLGPRMSESAVALAHRSPSSWRHKWVDRVELTAAEQDAASPSPYFLAPEAAGAFVAETSRGNLFCLGADGIWRTPPLDDHLLPGVTRREVLDLLGEYGIPHRVERFSRDALLTSVSALWTSSLSGAVEVTAVDGTPLTPARTLTTRINHSLGIAGPGSVSYDC